MKREGRQHGLVRTVGILPDQLNGRPESRLFNKLRSPPTAGSFTKVPSKPTNHSKFTGKYIQDPADPVSKPKDKIKGTHKLRSGDVVLNHRLLTWQVVAGRPGLNFAGVSGSSMVGHLAASDYVLNDEYYEEEEEEVDHHEEGMLSGYCGYSYSYSY